MVIFIYSNILSSVNMMNMTKVCGMQPICHLDCLKYLHETVKAPWNSYTASGAAENGHLHILEYLVERKYDQYYEFAGKCCQVRPLRLFEVLTRNRQSALGFGYCSLWLKMVIFIYSNILSSVNMMNMTKVCANAEPNSAT